MSGLGKVEGQLSALEEVIVICHKIEKPTAELLDAVRQNLASGIRYRFFVAKDNYESECKQYFRYFELIAEMARLDDPSKAIADLVTLLPLPIDWHDKPPFVFYRTRQNGDVRTIAYRGFTAGEGIDTKYVRVDPVLAHTVLEMLVSTVGPTREDILPEEFIVSDNVFRMDEARAKRS